MAVREFPIACETGMDAEFFGLEEGGDWEGFVVALSGAQVRQLEAKGRGDVIEALERILAEALPEPEEGREFFCTELSPDLAGILRRHGDVEETFQRIIREGLKRLEAALDA